MFYPFYERLNGYDGVKDRRRKADWIIDILILKNTISILHLLLQNFWANNIVRAEPITPPCPILSSHQIRWQSATVKPMVCSTFLATFIILPLNCLVLILDTLQKPLGALLQLRPLIFCSIRTMAFKNYLPLIKTLPFVDQFINYHRNKIIITMK